MRKLISTLISVILLLLIAVVTGIGYWASGSLPQLDGTQKLAGLSRPAQVDFDQYAIPQINAENRADAYRLLGFLTARDRLFQMDLIRRKMSGRLAEVMGAELLDLDRWHRAMGFAHVSSEILATLPDEQREILKVYSEGVNQAISGFKALPFEFLMLGYHPEPWRAEDSLLVVLSMYATLAWRGETERATTVMRAALPAPVVEFFLPRTDAYTEAVISGKPLERIATPLPATELARVLEGSRLAADYPGLIRDELQKRGSNAWVVAPSKSAGNRALLANDMHLELTVPNIWYRAELHYEDVHLAGVTLPGLPLLVSGSNRHIAWGFTSSGADVSDLILLDVDPEDPRNYRIPGGLRRFRERIEKIRIRGGTVESMTVRLSEWGPVLPEDLLEKAVAVRWTALDPAASNLDHLNLDRVTSVKDALHVLNRVGGPPLNAFVADAEGNIAWTMTGRIPMRPDKQGLFAHFSSHGVAEWNGYIPPDDLPRQINPSSGFLVSANQRMVDSEYPHAIGHYDWRGYRAYRITERLQEMNGITEKDLLALQLDTHSDFYRYYQNLALEVLKRESGKEREDIADLTHSLQAWNGQAERDSLGLGIIIEFRKELMEKIIGPYFAGCRELDPNFIYDWPYSDVALQQLLDSGSSELLPDQDRYRNRSEYIKSILLDSANAQKQQTGVENPDELNWEKVNKAHIVHPLSAALPWLDDLLDMPKNGLPGCSECVRNFFYDGGASERLVVAPGHEDDAILHMPAGQSQHPFSVHYRDQHPLWVQGTPVSLWARSNEHRLRFEPEIVGVKED